MEYTELRSMTKKEIILLLIPMIERAVKINDSWTNGNNGEHPTDKDFDSMDATASTWADLRDLHDDFCD